MCCVLYELKQTHTGGGKVRVYKDGNENEISSGRMSPLMEENEVKQEERKEKNGLNQ